MASSNWVLRTSRRNWQEKLRQVRWSSLLCSLSMDELLMLKFRVLFPTLGTFILQTNNSYISWKFSETSDLLLECLHFSSVIVTKLGGTAHPRQGLREHWDKCDWIWIWNGWLNPVYRVSILEVSSNNTWHLLTDVTASPQSLLLLQVWSSSLSLR